MSSSNRNTKARLTKKLANSSSSASNDSSLSGTLATTCYCHLHNYRNCTPCHSLSSSAVVPLVTTPASSSATSSSSVTSSSSSSNRNASQGIDVPKGFVEYTAAALFDRCRLSADNITNAINKISCSLCRSTIYHQLQQQIHRHQGQVKIHGTPWTIIQGKPQNNSHVSDYPSNLQLLHTTSSNPLAIQTNISFLPVSPLTLEQIRSVLSPTSATAPIAATRSGVVPSLQHLPLLSSASSSSSSSSTTDASFLYSSSSSSVSSKTYPSSSSSSSIPSNAGTVGWDNFPQHIDNSFSSVIDRLSRAKRILESKLGIYLGTNSLGMPQDLPEISKWKKKMETLCFDLEKRLSYGQTYQLAPTSKELLDIPKDILETLRFVYEEFTTSLHELYATLLVLLDYLAFVRSYIIQQYTTTVASTGSGTVVPSNRKEIDDTIVQNYKVCQDAVRDGWTKSTDTVYNEWKNFQGKAITIGNGNNYIVKEDNQGNARYIKVNNNKSSTDTGSGNPSTVSKENPYLPTWEMDLRTVGVVERIYTELTEYIQALIAQTGEVMHNDAQLMVEGMAKRRLNIPLPKNQVPIICSEQERIARRQGLAALTSSSSSSSSSSSTRSSTLYPDYKSIGNDVSLTGSGTSSSGITDHESASSSISATTPGPADLPFETILAWQQVFLVRIGAFTRSFGMRPLFDTHIDYLFSVYHFSKERKPRRPFDSIDIIQSSKSKKIRDDMMHELRIFDLPDPAEFETGRNLLGHLWSSYGTAWNTVRTIFNQAKTGNGTVTKVKDIVLPNDTEDTSDTVPLLKEDSVAQNASMDLLHQHSHDGYVPLPADEEEGIFGSSPFHTASTTASVRASTSVIPRPVTAHPAAEILNYLSMSPVADAYCAFLQASNKCFAVLSSPFMEDHTGKEANEAASALYARAAELIYRLGTLRARIANVAAQTNSNTSWIQPPLHLPNLASMVVAVASNNKTGTGNSNNSNERNREKDWETREETDEVRIRRLNFSFGEVPPRDVPRPVDPNVTVSTGNHDNSAPLPTIIPVLEHEHTALSVLMDRQLREAAERLQNMITFSSNPFDWLKDYENMNYDGPVMTMDRNRHVTTLGDDGRESGLRSILEKYWESTEEDFVHETSDPRCGARKWPRSYASARVLPLPWEKINRLQEASSANKVQNDHDYRLLEAQILRYEMLAGTEKIVPPINPKPLHEQEYAYKVENAIRIHGKDIPYKTGPIAPHTTKFFWYEPRNNKDNPLQFTTRDQDDREIYDNFSFLPRAGSNPVALLGGGSAKGSSPSSTFSHFTDSFLGNNNGTNNSITTMFCTSLPSKKETVPTEFIDNAVRVLDLAHRIEILHRYTLARIIPAYTSLCRTWYSIATFIALAPYRIDVTCLPDDTTVRTTETILANVAQEMLTDSLNVYSMGLLSEEDEGKKDKKDKGGKGKNSNSSSNNTKQGTGSTNVTGTEVSPAPIPSVLVPPPVVVSTSPVTEPVPVPTTAAEEFAGVTKPVTKEAKGTKNGKDNHDGRKESSDTKLSKTVTTVPNTEEGSEEWEVSGPRGKHKKERENTVNGGGTKEKKERTKAPDSGPGTNETTGKKEKKDSVKSDEVNPAVTTAKAVSSPTVSASALPKTSAKVPEESSKKGKPGKDTHDFKKDGAPVPGTVPPKRDADKADKVEAPEVSSSSTSTTTISATKVRPLSFAAAAATGTGAKTVPTTTPSTSPSVPVSTNVPKGKTPKATTAPKIETKEAAPTSSTATVASPAPTSVPSPQSNVSVSTAPEAKINTESPTVSTEVTVTETNPKSETVITSTVTDAPSTASTVEPTEVAVTEASPVVSTAKPLRLRAEAKEFNPIMTATTDTIESTVTSTTKDDKITNTVPVNMVIPPNSTMVPGTGSMMYPPRMMNVPFMGPNGVPLPNTMYPPTGYPPNYAVPMYPNMSIPTMIPNVPPSMMGTGVVPAPPLPPSNNPVNNPSSPSLDNTAVSTTTTVTVESTETTEVSEGTMLTGAAATAPEVKTKNGRHRGRTGPRNGGSSNHTGENKGTDTRTVPSVPPVSETIETVPSSAVPTIPGTTEGTAVTENPSNGTGGPLPSVPTVNAPVLPYPTVPNSTVYPSPPSYGMHTATNSTIPPNGIPYMAPQQYVPTNGYVPPNTMPSSNNGGVGFNPAYRPPMNMTNPNNPPSGYYAYPMPPRFPVSPNNNNNPISPQPFVPPTVSSVPPTTIVPLANTVTPSTAVPNPSLAVPQPSTIGNPSVRPNQVMNNPYLPYNSMAYMMNMNMNINVRNYMQQLQYQQQQLQYQQQQQQLHLQQQQQQQIGLTGSTVSSSSPPSSSSSSSSSSTHPLPPSLASDENTATVTKNEAKDPLSPPPTVNEANEAVASTDTTAVSSPSTTVGTVSQTDSSISTETLPVSNAPKASWSKVVSKKGSTGTNESNVGTTTNVSTLTPGTEIFDVSSTIVPDETMGGTTESTEDWEIATKGKKGRSSGRRREGKGNDDDTDTSSGTTTGLGNRYGENNCYLNTVVQAFYCLQPFRTKFIEKYAKLLSRRTSGKETVREMCAARLVSAMQQTLVRMNNSSNSKDTVLTTGVSLEPLKQALYQSLDNRATELSAKSSATLLAKNRLATGILSRTMEDASETLEEVITLLAEAEIVLSSPTIAALTSPVSLDLKLGDTQVPVALSTFGLLLQDTTNCPNCGKKSSPSMFTGFAQHINVTELLSVRATALSVLSATSSVKDATALPFYGLLRGVIEQADSRSCTQCNARSIRTHRTLRRPVDVVTVILGWSSPRESSEVLNPILNSLDAFIDLRAIFHEMNDVSPTPLPARLRGMICFVDNHWVAFFDTSPFGTSTKTSLSASWICCDDERIFPVNSPIEECRHHHLQPSILFYETLMMSTTIPDQRGRSLLHIDDVQKAIMHPSGTSGTGSAKGSGKTATTTTGLFSNLANHVSWGDVLADEESFPSLMTTTGNAHAAPGTTKNAVPSSSSSSSSTSSATRTHARKDPREPLAVPAPPPLPSQPPLPPSSSSSSSFSSSSFASAPMTKPGPYGGGGNTTKPNQGKSSNQPSPSPPPPQPQRPPASFSSTTSSNNNNNYNNNYKRKTDNAQRNFPASKK